MNKIRKIQNYLKDGKLGGFLVLTKTNRQYLSGFSGSAGVLLISRTGVELFVDDRYLIRARKESWIPVSPISKLATSPALRASFPRHGRRVGIEDRITLREATTLERDFPKAKWVATQNVIEDMRAVKSPQEIRNIKTGSKIIDATFRHLKKFIKMGHTEIEIAQEIEHFGKKMGADALAFDSIVAFGANAAAPHHFSSNQKIRRGNFLLLDFGFLVKGYHSDFTRTLFIGSPGKKQEKVYNTVLEAQETAIKKIKEGTKASQIDGAARDYIVAQGFGKYFTHNTGHGVGLEIHELPNFSAKSEDTLHSSMIVTVEPGIYIEKWGGVRIEDMVVVGKTSRVLSKAPKDLKSMII